MKGGETMNDVLLAGVGGFILGWLVEWLIDLFYWRRRAEEQANLSRSLRTSLDEKERSVLDLQTRLQEETSDLGAVRDQIEQGEVTIRDLTARIGEHNETISRLEAEVGERDEQIEALRMRSEAAEAQVDALKAAQQETELARTALRTELDMWKSAVERDDFEVIHGIGRTYEKRLHNAGILTYQQLASTAPEQIRVILNISSESRRIEPEAWIAEAARLAEQAPDDDPQD
jgi:predicted flap endonuclease-1-like 5' DNA nuclease/uncharacterized protein YjiS (DUF1127 family)